MKTTSILSPEQIERAKAWEVEHLHHVYELCLLSDDSYPPTLSEDKRDPALWKAAHWRWFFLNHDQ